MTSFAYNYQLELLSFLFLYENQGYCIHKTQVDLESS